MESQITQTAHRELCSRRQRDTHPSSLAVDVRGADVLGQVGAAGEQQLAVVPAAGVAQGLAACSCSAAVAVQHCRGGAATGHGALHIYESAANTGVKTSTH